MNSSYREEVIRGVNGIIEEKNEQNATERGYQLPGC